jgi:cytochrome P450
VDAAAALASLSVPEPPPGERGMAWLRASVCRFANGEAHRRRRALVEAELAALEPARLAEEAAAATRAALAGGAAVDVMPLARRIAVRVLCEALAGRVVAATVVEDAVAVAVAYPPGSPDADEALERLHAALGGEGEPAAARIALLAQACEATAGLIGNLLLGEPAPPVRLTRRVAADGSTVAIDLESAGLPFGAGPHACPGREHALAIARAVVETVRELAETVEDAPACERSPNLRVPSRVLVRPRHRVASAPADPPA